MAGIVTVKEKGKDIGKVVVKRPPYDLIKEKYLDLFPNNVDTGAPLDSAASVYFAYLWVGGHAFREYKRNPSAYGNACALRISYALNMSGMLIPSKVSVLPTTKLGGNRILQGGNEYVIDGGKYYYIYSVENLITFLEYAWGKADMFKYVPKRVSQLDELKKMNKKGIVIFYIDGFSDATGHATIWDGVKCLDGSTYYDPSLHPKQTLTAIKFWDLK